MKLHTPPENQGQMIDVSYGWHEGYLYRRTYDESDRSTAWHRASDDEEVQGYIASGEQPWNSEPPIKSWEKCKDPQID